MSKDEMKKILSEHLKEFRTCSYEQLVKHVEGGSFWKLQDCLDHIEDTAADGTDYQIEFNVYWNNKSQNEIMVNCDLSLVPPRRLWGVMPIYMSEVSDRFIMRADGNIAGES